MNSLASPAAPISEPGMDLAGAATLPVYWRQALAAYGEAPLIGYRGETLSYAEVDRRSAALARGLLARGAGKGTRIGLLLPNGVDWVIAWLAVSRIGGIAVALSSLAVGPELAYAIRQADVQLLLAADRRLRADYVARLEAAFPGLAEAAPGRPLALAEAPYLRGIWFTRPVARPWSLGLLADLEAEGEVSETISAALLAAVEEAVSPADPALIIYTSGSTADPKAVVHTQGVVVRRSVAMAACNSIMPSQLARGDRMLVTIPLFWIGGFLSLGAAIWRGATAFFADEQGPAALGKLIRDEAITHVGGAAAAVASLRSLGQLPPEAFARLKPQNTSQLALFHPEVDRRRICFALGMTETFGPHSGLIDGGFLPETAAGSVGPALPWVEYRIVDPETRAPVAPGEMGELLVRGEGLMDGMYKQERGAVFDADGFYATGDQCALSPDGYLFYGTRLSGVIKTAGANVSPEEVEAAIQAQPGILEAAVLGLPDRKLGQIVVAVVATAHGEPVDELDLKRRLKAQLSSFKVPKRIFTCAYEALPRTASQKIRKAKLAEMIAAKL